MEKISKLKKILEKYGHFYANEIIYGGAIIENNKDVNTQEKSSDYKKRSAKIVSSPSVEGGYEI